MTTPDGGTVRYGYDEYGKMKTLTSALGQVIGYEYDTLHRLAARATPMNIYNKYGEIVT